MKKTKKREALAACVMVAALTAALVLGFAGPLNVNKASAGDQAPSGGASGGTLVFNGTGRAHGVGMCMDGVHYRALAGQDGPVLSRWWSSPAWAACGSVPATTSVPR